MSPSNRQKKAVIACLIFLGLVIVGACGFMHLALVLPRAIDVSHIPEDDGEIIHFVDAFGDDTELISAFGDRVRYDGNGGAYIHVFGWACYQEQSIMQTNSYYLLKNVETGAFLRLRTEMRRRPAVTEIVASGKYDYDMAGLEAICPKWALERHTEYGLYLLYGNDGHALLVDLEQSIFIG